TARAERPKIAVLPFNGPQGVRAQGEAVRALRKKGEIVPMSAWNASAKKLFAPSRSASDYAPVANDLGVKVGVTGPTNPGRGGGRGSSGNSVERLKYPLRGPRLDPATLRRLSDDIGPSVDSVLNGAQPTGEEPNAEGAAPNTPEAAGGDNGRNIEDEDPLAKK